MNADQFHNLLVTIATTKDNEERNASEAAFIAFRDCSPSDAFMQLLIAEAVTASDVQQHAQVLLRQDLDKNEENAAIYRMSQEGLGNELMVKLLHFLASSPSDKLGEVVERYAFQEIQHERVFQPILGFIQQGLTAAVPIKRLASHLIQEITVWPGFRVQQLQFDFLSALQQMCGDEDVFVRLNAVRALGQLVANNEDQVGAPIIQEEQISSLLRAMLSVTAGMISNASEREQAERALTALLNTVSLRGGDTLGIITEILDLVEQLAAANLSEEFTRQAINIFATVTESCAKARKAQKERYSNFLQFQVIPRLVPSAEALERWAQGIDENVEFQDNSLQKSAENCLSDAAYVLGKVVVNPLLQKLVKEAVASQNDAVCMAALIGSAAASFGMGDVCSVKEIQVFVDAAVKLTAHANPRVRFEALNALGAFATNYEQKIKGMAGQIITVLCAGAQDQMEQIRTVSFASMTQVVGQFDYEQLYQYLEMIWNMIDAGLAKDIKTASSALQILKVLCDAIDSEDLEPILSRFMPGILSQFGSIMPELKAVDQLTVYQSNLIHSLIAVISSAATSNSELFEGCIDEIMANFIILLQKANEALLDDIFGEVVMAMSQLVEPFSAQMVPYLEQMLAVFHNALTKDVVSSQGQLSTEDDEVDMLVITQQSNILAFLADFMDTNAKALAPYFEQISALLISFIPTTLKQTVIHYHAIGQLINLAREVGADAMGLFRTYFPKVVAQMMATPENNDIASIQAIDLLADAIDAFAISARSFFRLISAGAQFEERDAVYAQIFEVLSHCHDQANAMLAETIQDLKLSEEDVEQEELGATVEEAFEYHKDCLEVLGVAYLQFIQELKTFNTPQTYMQLSNVIQRFLQAGVDTKPHQQAVIEGISLLSDTAEHLDAQTCMTFFAQAMDQLFAILRNQSLTNYDLWRNMFFALYNYIKTTGDPNVAGSQELLSISLNMLNQMKEIGSEEAMGAYDNICSFLLVAGKITGQGADYWAPLFKYCLEMDNDECEVRHACEFIITEIEAGNQLVLAAADQALKTLVRLFFGKFCSTFRNDPEDKKLVTLMTDFTAKHFQAIQKEAGQSGKFVMKNFTSFKTTVNRK